MKAIRLLFAVVAVSACGGSPTSPTFLTSPDNSCVPQTAQCLLDGAVLGLTVNGVDVAAGSTGSVATGSTFALRISYTNSTGQNVWFGFVFVRDDGMERLSNCVGLGGGFSSGGVNLTALIPPNDSLFVPGHTVRASVVAMFGPSPSEGQCPLRTSTGQLDHTAVHGRRQLLTLVMQ